MCGKGKEVKGRANFFYNHQQLCSVWLELSVDLQGWPQGTELELTAPGVLQPFPVSMSGIHMAMQDGMMTACAVVDPLREPIESVAAPALQHVSCAVLDSPISKHGLHTSGGAFTIRCAQFEAVFAPPSDTHSAIANELGSTPHMLSQSITLRECGGHPFGSSCASTAINTIHDILSFAAGRWVGLTLIEGFDSSGKRGWFQFGTTKSSEAYRQVSWFDQDHPEWLNGLCDGLLALQTDEQAADIMHRVLYWYSRSNANRIGVDGALILTQCALELLSWFVIVKRTRALSEGGYGQLADASEKVRLMLSLLGIPAPLPPGLTKLAALNREWKNVAEAIVKGRNYLVHPTQSRSGKLTETKKYPWYELWVLGRWVLELVILRLLDYKGDYLNRTRLMEFQRMERVPWAR
jgi:hypothetical protein